MHVCTSREYGLGDLRIGRKEGAVGDYGKHIINLFIMFMLTVEQVLRDLALHTLIISRRIKAKRTSSAL